MALGCPSSDGSTYISSCGATYAIECYSDRYGDDSMYQLFVCDGALLKLSQFLVAPRTPTLSMTVLRIATTPTAASMCRTYLDLPVLATRRAVSQTFARTITYLVLVNFHSAQRPPSSSSTASVWSATPQCLRRSQLRSVESTALTTLTLRDQPQSPRRPPLQLFATPLCKCID